MMIIGFSNSEFKNSTTRSNTHCYGENALLKEKEQEQLTDDGGMEKGGGIVLAIQIVAVTIIFSIMFSYQHCFCG